MLRNYEQNYYSVAREGRLYDLSCFKGDNRENTRKDLVTGPFFIAFQNSLVLEYMLLLVLMSLIRMLDQCCYFPIPIINYAPQRIERNRLHTNEPKS